MRAERVVKKLVIKHRMNRKKQRNILNNEWRKISGAELSFLELEPTLAIWSHLRSRHILCENSIIKKFVSDDIREDVMLYLNEFAHILARFGAVYGICFAYQWDVTGAFLINLKEVAENLNDFMFICEDEVKFYSADFTKAILLSGDRTGTGDQLNELKVSVLGADWGNVWKSHMK